MSDKHRGPASLDARAERIVLSLGRFAPLAAFVLLGILAGVEVSHTWRDAYESTARHAGTGPLIDLAFGLGASTLYFTGAACMQVARIWRDRQRTTVRVDTEERTT